MTITLPADLAEGLQDAARRLAERHNLALLNLTFEEIHAGRWIACRLSDGDCRTELFETRRDAVRHAGDERWWTFVRVQIQHMPVREAATIIAWYRLLSRDGQLQMIPPDREPIMPNTTEAVLSVATRHLLPVEMPAEFLEMLRDLP